MQALREPAKVNTESANENNNPYTGQWEATDPIPTIFSYSVIRKNGKIGDQIVLLISGQPVTFEVRGIIADFPTLTTDFVIVNSKIFEEVISKTDCCSNSEPRSLDKYSWV